MKSFLSYLGGKSLLARKIIPCIPEHTCYAEVFCGASWLLFKKEESEVEIINDINKDLVNLYRVVQLHLDEFVRYFKWALTARDEFDRLKKVNSETLTDIQRAARFYYLLRNSYGSKLTGQTFNIPTTRRSNFNLLRIEEDLSAAHLRLARVSIENKPFQEFILRFDKPHTFFYIDPPYFGCENDYGKGIFDRGDFGGFRIKEVITTYCVSGADKKKKVKELLIMNF